MVKVLILGNGAREHAMSEALVKGGAELYAYMAKMNPGIAQLSKNNVKIGNLNNFTEIIDSRFFPIFSIKNKLKSFN